MRKFVAVFFHLPGLRLFYGAKATPSLLRTNLWAVLATLAAMALAAFMVTPSYRWMAALIVWAIGHFAWGLYLGKMA